MTAAATCRKNEQGFSIPELISVIAVTALFSGLIVYFAFQYWRSGAVLSNSLETFVGRLNAGDRLRESLNSASGMIIQNGIEDNNAGEPDTAIPGGTYWKPLHAVPGSTTVGAPGTIKAVAYFRAPSINTSKNIVMNGAQPYEDEFVLYLDGTTKELRMRVLANASAASNRNVTTCPPASATATCPPDKLITGDLSAVDLRFFSRSGNLIDHQSIIDPITGEYIGPDYPSVEVIEFTLSVFKKSTLKGGADTINQTVIRVALRNS